MKRRYVCIPTGGHLEANLERIRSHIRNEHLAHRYPVVRYERPQHQSRRGRGQLYLFLGLDLDSEEQARSIPSDDWAFLRRIGFHPLKDLLEEREIKSMTGTNQVSMEGFWFRYEQAEIPPPPDTLEQWDELTRMEESATAIVDTQAATKRFDHLLWWISARGYGNWADLATAIEILNVGKGQLTPPAVVRNLVLLGHIESLPLDGKWSVAPRCRVTMALDNDQSFIAGARIPDDTRLEINNDTFILQPQPGSAGPMRITMKYGRPHRFADMENVGQSGVTLADLLPNLTEWIDELPVYDRPSLGGGKIERFDGRSWQRDSSMIETDFGYRGETGLYRFVSSDEHPLWSAYFKVESQRWHRADLTGLKFAALSSHASDKLQVFLSKTTGDLLIPRSQRWPLIYERALVLASGWLPEMNQGYLRYRQAGVPITQRLTAKLGIKLTED